MAKETSMNMRDLRSVNPAAASVMELIKGDLIIVLLERLGGKAAVTVKELDDVPRGRGVTLNVDHATQTIHFEVLQNKSGK